jgi:hypothetical protein
MPSASDVLTVALIMLAGVLVWFALSPFETLGWWAGWFGDRIYWPSLPDESETHSEETLCHIVFFSGIGRTSGETLSYREREFLRMLNEKLPEAVVIDDIFPFATNNLALTEQPWLKSFWRFALRSKMGSVPIAGYLINLRNIAQILVSADRRYGPIFNQGVAEVIVNGLLRHGYPHEFMGNAPADGRPPVFLIGYSGAAQTALGAAGYVKEWLDCPLYVISLGGVFFSDPSLLEIDQIYHLVGSRDAIEKVGHIPPGRWSIFATSEWNRAIKQGKVTKVQMGTMRHTGGGGYLDAKSELPNGESYVDHTVDIVGRIVRTELAANHMIAPLSPLVEVGAPVEMVNQ